MAESNSSPVAALSLFDEEKIRDVPPADLGRRVVELNTNLRSCHALAMSAGSMTVRHAVALGQIFQEASRRFHGDFSGWLLASVGEDAEGRPALAYETARRYRTLWEKRDRLFPPGGEEPECRTLVEAYQKVGLIPAPKPEEEGRGPQKVFRLTFTAPAVAPEEMPAADRREFLTKAEPIVDLYNRLKAIGEAA